MIHLYLIFLYHAHTQHTLVTHPPTHRVFFSGHEAGWPGVPAHIPHEGPRGNNGGAGAPVPGGEGHCLAEEGQGVHCGGWGWSGDGEAAAEEDGGAERRWGWRLVVVVQGRNKVREKVTSMKFDGLGRLVRED